MKPKAMPWAIEKVSGMEIAVTTPGAYSVTSSQSSSAMPRAIRQATKNSAGAVHLKEGRRQRRRRRGDAVEWREAEQDADRRHRQDRDHDRAADAERIEADHDEEAEAGEDRRRRLEIADADQRRLVLDDD